MANLVNVVQKVTHILFIHKVLNDFNENESWER